MRGSPAASGVLPLCCGAQLFGGRHIFNRMRGNSAVTGRLILNPGLEEGAVTPRTALDLAPERVGEKVSWVREAAEAAGRDFSEIELNSLSFTVAITDLRATHPIPA